ncbi:hypothetical protein HZS_8121 [Henneguya salminicola]|nr:hypothetical protein HZS_8121 [Henneguya salminicola]
MDIIENTLQSELTASITHNKNDLNDAILSITPEKSVYQKFEPSISEIKEIKLEKNNILEYVANKSENPCNLILTRVLSRSAVSLPKCTTGILTKARSFLSYIIIICSRSFENFSKERLNLTWNNPGQDEKSIIIWAKDSVLTVDIKITENEYEIHNDNAIESFKNVLTACMSSSSLFIAVASENNNVTVCHRINSNSKYEFLSIFYCRNYLFTTENMTNEQIISLKLIERDIQTLIPSTLIILTANHIVFYDLFDPYDKIRMFIDINDKLDPF